MLCYQIYQFHGKLDFARNTCTCIIHWPQLSLFIQLLPQCLSTFTTYQKNYIKSSLQIHAYKYVFVKLKIWLISKFMNVRKNWNQYSFFPRAIMKTNRFIKYFWSIKKIEKGTKSKNTIFNSISVTSIISSFWIKDLEMLRHFLRRCYSVLPTLLIFWPNLGEIANFFFFWNC